MSLFHTRGFSFKWAWDICKAHNNNNTWSSPLTVTLIFHRSRIDLLNLFSCSIKTVFTHLEWILSLIQVKEIDQRFSHVQTSKFRPYIRRHFLLRTCRRVLSPRLVIIALWDFSIIIIFSFSIRASSIFSDPFNASNKPC